MKATFQLLFSKLAWLQPTADVLYGLIPSFVFRVMQPSIETLCTISNALEIALFQVLTVLKTMSTKISLSCWYT